MSKKDNIEWTDELEKRVVSTVLTRYKDKIPINGDVTSVDVVRGWLECLSFIKTECCDIFVNT